MNGGALPFTSSVLMLVQLLYSVVKASLGLHKMVYATPQQDCHIECKCPINLFKIRFLLNEPCEIVIKACIN